MTVLAFIVIILVALLILWVVWLTVRNESPKPPAENKSFLSKCETSNDCDPGLSCDANTCKRQIGQPCKTVSDCVSEAVACTDGKCSEVVPGQLYSPAPCNEGLVPDENGICRKPEGDSCTLDTECITFVCMNSMCSPKLPEGSPCKPNQCDTGLACIRGTCQDPLNIQTTTENNLDLEIQEQNTSEWSINQNGELIYMGYVMHNGMHGNGALTSFTVESECECGDSCIVLHFDNGKSIRYFLKFIEGTPFIVKAK